MLPDAGSQLTFSGEIGGTGGLTIDNAGTVVLSGANGYTGGTTVSAGTLIVSNSSAIAAGTNLAIGADAAGIFNSSTITTSGDATIASGTARRSDHRHAGCHARRQVGCNIEHHDRNDCRAACHRPGFAPRSANRRADQIHSRRRFERACRELGWLVVNCQENCRGSALAGATFEQFE